MGKFNSILGKIPVTQFLEKFLELSFWKNSWNSIFRKIPGTRFLEKFLELSFWENSNQFSEILLKLNFQENSWKFSLGSLPENSSFQEISRPGISSSVTHLVDVHLNKTSINFIQPSVNARNSFFEHLETLVREDSRPSKSHSPLIVFGARVLV